MVKFNVEIKGPGDVLLNGKPCNTLRSQYRYVGRSGDYVLKVDDRANREFSYYHQTSEEIKFLKDKVEPQDKKYFPEIVATGLSFGPHGKLCPWLITPFVELEDVCTNDDVGELARDIKEKYELADIDGFTPDSTLWNWGVNKGTQEPFLFDVGLDQSNY